MLNIKEEESNANKQIKTVRRQCLFDGESKEGSEVRTMPLKLRLVVEHNKHIWPLFIQMLLLLLLLLLRYSPSFR